MWLFWAMFNWDPSGGIYIRDSDKTMDAVEQACEQ